MAMIFVVAFFFFRSQKPHRVADEDETTGVSRENNAGAISQKVMSANIAGTSSTVGAAVATAPAQQAPISENIMKLFGENLAAMQKCLGISAATPGPAVPSPENLLNFLRPALGETVVQIDDWTQTDLIDKAGVKKRMRVDFDYPDGVTANRRLSMYTVNSYGALEIDNLTNDQSDNPNAAYVESLKEGNQVVSEEKAARAYFSQGEEVVYTMKNGRLDTVSVSKGDRAMNCSNLSDDTAKCSCP